MKPSSSRVGPARGRPGLPAVQNTNDNGGRCGTDLNELPDISFGGPSVEPAQAASQRAIQNTVSDLLWALNNEFIYGSYLRNLRDWFNILVENQPLNSALLEILFFLHIYY